jgi:hypothetical protein
MATTKKATQRTKSQGRGGVNKGEKTATEKRDLIGKKISQPTLAQANEVRKARGEKPMTVEEFRRSMAARDRQLEGVKSKKRQAAKTPTPSVA